MLFQLPTFHALLAPCLVGPAAFTPHADGKFCSSCQRVVQDFSRSEDPVADLAAARAAAPDGRVCGSFRREQVVVPPAPTLSRRLRWFVLALVLVVGQGLTARQALAQVRRPVPKHKPTSKHAPRPSTPEEVPDILDGIVAIEIPLSPSDTTTVRTYAEVMPTLQGRNYQQIAAYIQQQVRWPAGADPREAEGRVFVRFVVGKDGLVRDTQLLKGIHPLCDAEALRIIRSLPAFTPGRQGGRPVAVSFTVPVTFKQD